MAPRSSRPRSRYDDPYTFDDPYIRSPPTSRNQPAYEYIGTDEPLSPRITSPPHHTFSPDQERARRYARTTSPPQYTRRGRANTLPAHESRPSSSPQPKDRHRGKSHDRKHPKKHFYQDFAKNNPKLQQYGKQGLTFLSEAAAAYAAAQAGKDEAKGANDNSRGRSVDYSDRHGRSSRHSSSRHHSHRRHASSPSRSPSPPPRRRHSTRHGDRDRDRDRSREYHHRRRHSPSPPPLSRDPDSYLASRHGSDREKERERGRDRRHRHRPQSPSPSPPPSRRSRARNSTAPPANPAVDRWQMAARAALEAGGLTAFRLRKEPGSWTGDKAAKVATAAIGAAAMDAFMDQDPRAAKGGMKGMAENAITSLLASQIMGKASKRRGRSRF